MVEEDKVPRQYRGCQLGQCIMWNCTNCFRRSHENMILCRRAKRKIVRVSFYVLSNGAASEATQGPLPEIRVLFRGTFVFRATFLRDLAMSTPNPGSWYSCPKWRHKSHKHRVEPSLACTGHRGLPHKKGMRQSSEICLFASRWRRTVVHYCITLQAIRARLPILPLLSWQSLFRPTQTLADFQQYNSQIQTNAKMVTRYRRCCFSTILTQLELNLIS